MRGRLTSVILVCVALVATGCSSSSESSPKAAGPSYWACYGCLGRDPLITGPMVVRGASRGGTVTVLTHHGLAGTLDPSEVSRPDVLSIDQGLLTRSLTQYRWDATDHQMTLVPDLATDLGMPNDTYTRWVFTIRHGARFEDGTPVTAADVVRGIHRCQRSTTFPTGPCQDLARGRLESARVTSNRRTVLFAFDAPVPELPYLTTFPELGPVPSGTSLDPASYRLHPLATGPYRIERYTPSSRLVLVRNSQWDPATDPARTAYPDRYVFRSGVPSWQVDRKVGSGSGTTLTYDDVRPADVPEVRDAGRLVTGPDSCLTYWAPDDRSVADVRVRRALAWAYPYRSLMRAQGLVPGLTAVPARSLQPPTAPDPPPVPVVGPGGFRTAPGRARHLLQEAGALGRRLRFAAYPGSATGRREEHLLERAMRRAGFTPQPVEVVGSLAASMRGPRVDVRTSTWCADFPDGAATVPALLRTPNLARFSQPSVERSIRRTQRLPLDQQAHAWTRLDRAVMRRWWPVVPLWTGRVAMAHGDRIHGTVVDPLLGMPDWKGLWLAP